MKSALFFLYFLFLIFPVFGKNNISIESPSGNIVLNTQLINNKLYYSVSNKLEQLFQLSSLGFVLKGNDSITDFKIIHHENTTYNETWKPVWGQFNSINNHYNQIIIYLEDVLKKRPLEICFRVYNDGFAFRYHMPSVNSDIEIMSEESRFNFVENHDCWWIWADYNTLEKLYNHTDLKQASHVAAPFTMKTNKGTYISIHEATLDDYSSMTLKQDQKDSLSFKVNLVPWADGSAVKKSSSFYSPWRTVFISSTAGGLIESSLLLNLNEPSVIEDCS